MSASSGMWLFRARSVARLKSSSHLFALISSTSSSTTLCHFNAISRLCVLGALMLERCGSLPRVERFAVGVRLEPDRFHQRAALTAANASVRQLFLEAADSLE